MAWSHHAGFSDVGRGDRRYQWWNDETPKAWNSAWTDQCHGQDRGDFADVAGTLLHGLDTHKARGFFWQHQIQLILAFGRMYRKPLADFSHSAFGSLNFLHKCLLILVQANANIGFDALLLPLYFLHCWGTWRNNSNSFVELIISETKVSMYHHMTTASEKGKDGQLSKHAELEAHWSHGLMESDVDVIGWHFFGELCYRTAAWRMRFTRRVHWAGFVCQGPQLPLSKQDPWLVYCRCGYCICRSWSVLLQFACWKIMNGSIPS